MEKEPIDFLVLDFPPEKGGIQTYCYETISRLAKTHPVQVTAFRRCQQEEAYFDSKQDFKITRFWIPKILGRRIALRYFLIRIFLQKAFCLFFGQKSVFHCTHLVTGLVGYGLNYLLGASYVVWTYGLEISSFSRWWVKPVLQKAESILTISEFTKKQLLSFGIAENCIVKVYPGINPLLSKTYSPSVWRKIETEYSLQGSKILLTVSSLTKLQRYKGIDVVLQALPIILNSIPEVRYLVVGTGNDISYLTTLANQLGVASSVHFLGSVTDEELAALYAHCNLFVMPSREVTQSKRYHYEGFGIVYLEANAFGKPVIGGDCGGIQDAILDHQTGFLIDPTNIYQLVDKILCLLKDTELSKKFGENGRNRVLREFNWDHAVFQLRNQIVERGVNA